MVVANEVKTIITTLALLQLSASEEIDVRFTCNNRNCTGSRGRVQFKYEEEWVSICYNGVKKAWGEKEAMVACKELLYEGGWPYSESKTRHDDSHKYLHSFDCEKDVTKLKICEFEIGDVCKNLAGVQCYHSFEVKLVGGAILNAGRVEVKYDDEWSSVCYETKKSKTRKWNFNNAQVLCKELGFPGTMFARQGGQGNGTRQSIVGGFRCSEDLIEDSLQTCLPNTPIRLSALNTGSSCDFDGGREGTEAVAVCAAPGYIGCYDKPGTWTSEQVQSSGVNMTINTCRNFCRAHNFTLAYLHKGDTCLCSEDITLTEVGDQKCTTECTGNSDQVCGDDNTVSVYDVTEGLCNDPFNKSAIYYFGDILDDFGCDPGMDPPPIQCIMGRSSDDMKWNSTDLACRSNTKITPLITPIAGNEKSDGEGLIRTETKDGSNIHMETKDGSNIHMGKVSGVTVGVLFPISVVFAVVTLVVKRNNANQERKSEDTDSNSTPDSTTTMLTGSSASTTNGTCHSKSPCQQSLMEQSHQEMTCHGKSPCQQSLMEQSHQEMNGNCANSSSSSSSDESVYYEISENPMEEGENHAYSEVQNDRSFMAVNSSETIDYRTGIGDDRKSSENSLHNAYAEIPENRTLQPVPEVNGFKQQLATTEVVSDKGFQVPSMKDTYERETKPNKEGWVENKIYNM